MATEPDSSQEHRYRSIIIESSTTTKRALLCQARNLDGTVDDRYVFAVKSEFAIYVFSDLHNSEPGSPPQDVNVIVDPDNHVSITWHEPKYPNGIITVNDSAFLR